MKPLVLLGVAACLLASGCDDSKNPLSDPQKSKADEKLIGIWRIPDKDGDEFYHVGRAGEKFPKGMLRIVEIRHSKQEVAPPEEYLAFPTVIGNKTYLNVVWDEKQVRQLDQNGWKAEAVGSYAILRYEVDGDKLVVLLIDEDAKSKAVKDGKLKGVERTNVATFTDTSENVARFVAAAGDDFWNTKEPGRFERVKLVKKL